MQKIHLIVALLATLLAGVQSGAAQAAQVDGLYEGEVPVPDKSESERRLAFSAALRNVLIKLTGDRNPQTNELVIESMREPSKFVEQYQYRTLTLDVLDELDLASEELVLWTRFDRVAIDELLTLARLPIWGRTRPSVLVWLALENESTRALVGELESSSLVGVMRDAAQRRGVPLLVPELDELDQAVVSVSDVWAGFDDRIHQASRRYNPDALLVVRGRLNSSGGWQGRWRLISGNSVEEYTSTDESLDVVLVDGVERAADVLAGRYARVVSAASDDSVTLVVDSVRDVHDFARVVTYLQTLDGVTRVEVTQVKADRVAVSLQVRGGALVAAQTISLGRVLSPAEGNDDFHYSLSR